MLSGISNPRPGLTPETVLRAVGSGINALAGYIEQYTILN